MMGWVSVFLVGLSVELKLSSEVSSLQLSLKFAGGDKSSES